MGKVKTLKTVETKVDDSAMKRAEIIDSIKGDFGKANIAYRKFNEKQAVFALRFCQAHLDYRETFPEKERKAKGTLIAFVRAIDPNTPKERAEYKRYSSYMTADNLAQLAMPVLVAEAEKAFSKGKATDQQKALVVARKNGKGRKDGKRQSKDKKTASKAKAVAVNEGEEVDLSIILLAVVMAGIGAEEFKPALKAAGCNAALIPAIIELLKVAEKQADEK